MASFRVGITGGIGSGKSVVSKIFNCLGIPVYYADREAKRLMENDPLLRERIKILFGEDAYQGGQLNRPKISEAAFRNPALLEQLNAIVHPATIADALHWATEVNAPYAIREAAIFFESGSAGGLDYIIGVYAPQALRIQRVIHRDGISREAILRRMQNQIDESLKMQLCDTVIYNDEIQPLIPQVLAIHEALLNRINAASPAHL